MTTPAVSPAGPSGSTTTPTPGASSAPGAPASSTPPASTPSAAPTSTPPASATPAEPGAGAPPSPAAPTPDAGSTPASPEAAAPRPPEDRAEDLVPRAGETAEAYATRLREAGVDLKRSPAAPAPSATEPAPPPAPLRQQLTAIHTRLAPVSVEQVLQTVAPPEAADLAALQTAVTDAYEGYKTAGEGEADAAWKRYQDANNLLTRAQTYHEQAQRLTQQENRRRQTVRAQQTRAAVSDHVTQIAPDVDPDLFWGYAPRAQAETPAHLTDPATRLEWQIQRSVALARAKQRAFTQSATRAVNETAQHAAVAAAVMPAGGSAPPTEPTPPTPEANTFANQLRGLRRKVLS